MDVSCARSGCVKAAAHRGYCPTHYNQERRSGRLALLPRIPACIVDGCGRKVAGRGLCKSHHMRWLRHGDVSPEVPLNRPPRAGRTCDVGGCNGTTQRSREFCPKHYQRWRKHGDVNHVEIDWNTDRRFRSKYIVTASGCWEWQGRDKNQYGHARWVVRSKRQGVHRWSYERFVAPIPPGLVVDHLCSNPPCVNPAHLEPVTQRENLRRARERIT